jgi:hypothetical protein
MHDQLAGGEVGRTAEGRCSGVQGHGVHGVVKGTFSQVSTCGPEGLTLTRR